MQDLTYHFTQIGALTPSKVDRKWSSSTAARISLAVTLSVTAQGSLTEAWHGDVTVQPISCSILLYVRTDGTLSLVPADSFHWSLHKKLVVFWTARHLQFRYLPPMASSLKYIGCPSNKVVRQCETKLTYLQLSEKWLWFFYSDLTVLVVWAQALQLRWWRL